MWQLIKRLISSVFKRRKRTYMLGDDGTLTEPLLKGRCPDCNGVEFFAGPQGGMCQNFECCSCGARFNVAFGPVGGIMGAERI